jgi:hypothetical protein
MAKVGKVAIGVLVVLALIPGSGLAQDEDNEPYFITYTHYLEEPRALEIEAATVLGRDHDINTFWAGWNEFEYGATRWWTSALYLAWQHTKHEGSVFTGLRFENRFRPFLEEHRINPVLYVEYEHLNGADKILKEIVGFDSKQDLAVPNSVARKEHEREIETKLILSSEIGRWNVSENFIGVKNIHGGPWEFGYAFGVSRPLGTSGGRRCAFCASSFTAGAEVYGGLGEWGDFTMRGTSQYLAPVFYWTLPGETRFRFSPGWGLTDESVRSLIRFSVSHDIDDFAHLFRKIIHKP